MTEGIGLMIMPLSVIGSSQAYYGLANDAVLLNKSDGEQRVTVIAQQQWQRGERGCACGARMQAVQRLKSVDLQGGMPRPAA